MKCLLEFIAISKIKMMIATPVSTIYLMLEEEPYQKIWRKPSKKSQLASREESWDTSPSTRTSSMAFVSFLLPISSSHLSPVSSVRIQ